ncbi:MAG TPA: long-chain fatty acid--CoA ligase [Bacteriovoracaceae bacterium]|nr:long-chain fatty acid--CoA ligase [Bacteriovoracaceae bacterium]
MVQNPRTLGRLLRERLHKTPDRYAMGWIENSEVKNITFREYFRLIELLVGAFHRLGIVPGDKVAILSQTCKEWHLLDMATLCSRACLVPVYPSYLTPEVDHIFTHSDSSVIIVENDKQFEKVLPLIKKWKNLKLIISIQELSKENLTKIQDLCPYHCYKELSSIGAEENKNSADHLENLLLSQLPEELASIIYTSGTTGEPKGAVITQHALATMLMNVEASTKGAFNVNDKTLVFLPLSHVLGRCDSLLPIIFGWQAIYAESMEKLIDNIQLVKPTVMIAVPRIFEKIYSKIIDQTTSGNAAQRHAFNWAIRAAEKYYAKIDKDLSPSTGEILEYAAAQKLVFSKIYNRFGGKIRYFVSGGAPLSPKIIKLLRYANLTILEGYGLTETIAPCCLNPMAKQVPGTVGRPMGDVQISFGPDNEILIKSEAMMKEYYKNPKATAETMLDGWLHTGDIGEFTAEGFLRITDRKKDIIITSGGKNVAPQKLENLAKTKPHISHLIVIGDKRNFLTALVGIEKERFLSMLDELDLRPNSSVMDLAQHPMVLEVIKKEIEEINQDLAQYENIKKFTIVTEEFTTENYLTPSLKIKRKLVNERYKDKIEAMYQ